MADEKEFFFTFGHGQIPGIGRYCRIKASTHIEAREIMASRTLKFAFMYDSAEAAGVERYNLQECFWDEANRGWSEYKV